MQKKIKILFILPSLTAGGAQRVISFIATHLDKNKFESILIVVGKPEEAVYRTQGIKVKFLNKKRVLTAIPIIFKLILLAKSAQPKHHTQLHLEFFRQYYLLDLSDN